MVEDDDDPGEPPEPIDYSPDSGAVDPEHAAQDQSESIKTDRHSYTENATYIGGELDAPSNKDVTWADDDSEGTRWDTLNEANRDFHANDDSSIKTAQRNTDYRHDVQTWGRQIGLTSHEIRRAVYLTAQTTPQQRRRHSMDAVILGALTLAGNEGRDVSNTAPRAIRPQLANEENTDSFESLTDAYTSIRETLGVTPQDVTATRNLIREHL